MPNIPLVSVIVPVYNVDRYIDRCLKSIVNQTYLNTEIILVDDGATDDSSQICEQYAMLDERIKIVSQLNQGQSAARNRALDIATGEYVVFVDSDDYIHYEAIQILMSGIHSYKADIAICDYYLQTDEAMHCDPIADFSHTIIDKDAVFFNLFSERHMMYGCVGGKAFKTNLFSNNRFPEGRVYEDTYLVPDLLNSADTIVATDCKLYYYYCRNNSTSRGWDDRKIEDSLYATYHRVTLFRTDTKNDDLLMKATSFHLNHAINSFPKIQSNCGRKIVRYYYHIVWRYCNKKYYKTQERILYSVFDIFPVLYRLIKKVCDKLS